MQFGVEDLDTSGCRDVPAAVTAPAPDFRRYMATGSSSLVRTNSLRLRMISVTSSTTPGSVLNSC